MLSHLCGPQFVNQNGHNRVVASNHPGGAAPPRNLSAPPGKFAHHIILGQIQESYQFISYVALHGSSCLCTKPWDFEFCIWTQQPENLPGILCTSRNIHFWLHPWAWDTEISQPNGLLVGFCPFMYNIHQSGGLFQYSVRCLLIRSHKI